ncbi:DUF1761 domain-containing protein [Oricola indica]|jgi:hypothetical protein|uniref:DUF1761 domain-containing protein n=1 Tax=Oricola indica TaxID=2872591 RepID=UPI001CBAB1A9|nr:DUF1761 domain-containing protein [Oricola indica]
MSFGGANYIAILVAAVAAYLAGAIYYGWMGKTWMKAARIDPADAKMSLPLMVVGFVCELIMAWVMAGVIGHFGDVSIKTGLISGFLLWLGFMATTLTVNQRYQGFGWDLSLIDGLHWLIVALLMGGILGAFGV